MGEGKGLIMLYFDGVLVALCEKSLTSIHMFCVLFYRLYFIEKLNKNQIYMSGPYVEECLGERGSIHLVHIY